MLNIVHVTIMNGRGCNAQPVHLMITLPSKIVRLPKVGIY